MAYAYCTKRGCDGELDEPTPEEVLEGEQVCPSCGRGNSTTKTPNDLILELVARIEFLEAQLP